MDIINALKDANIFSHEDISLFENNLGMHGGNNFMLLINSQYVFPFLTRKINNIIKEHTKKVPEDIYKINGSDDCVMYLCIRRS